jgi:hypothetical protein
MDEGSAARANAAFAKTTIQSINVMKKLPTGDEDVLWTLHKDGRRVEARIGTESVGGGQPELRLYTTSDEKGVFGRLYCQVTKDRRAARGLADEKRREFEAKGWAKE